jgi:hypothetical protein
MIGLNPNRKQEAIDVLTSALQLISRFPVVTPCNECENFLRGFCNYYGMEVPPEAQATGCDSWKEVIPF